MESLFPAASRIFLQTHVWPTALRDGRASEVHLQMAGEGGARIFLVEDHPGDASLTRALLDDGATAVSEMH